LYLIRNKEFNLVVDAIVTVSQSWSLLQQAPITAEQMREDFEGLKQSQKSNQTVYIRDASTSKSSTMKRASVMCIPIILQNKSLGSLYLIHNTKKAAFDTIQVPVVSSLLVNLMQMINTYFTKRDTVAKKRASSSPLSHIKNFNSASIKLQDTFFVYEENGDTWSSRFVVLSESIMIFSTPYESHCEHQFSLSCITSAQITSTKQIGRNIISSSWDKKISACTLIFIETTNQNFWFAFTSADTANDWLKHLINFKNNSSVVPKNLQIDEDDVFVDKDFIIDDNDHIISHGKFQDICVTVKRFSEGSNISAFSEELDVLQKVRHPNVMNIFGAFISGAGQPTVIMEAVHDSLRNIIDGPSTDFSGTKKHRILVQLANALTHLHSAHPPISHGNLTPSNIFITKDWTVKLGNFKSQFTKQNSSKWTAPELLLNSSYTSKADVYSFSLIMWEILSQQHCFQEIPMAQLSEQVVNNLRPSVSHFSSPTTKLLLQCWASDPNERPAASVLAYLVQSLSVTDMKIQ